MDFDPYSLAVLHVAAQYMAETYVLRNLLLEKGVLSASDYDAAMKGFSEKNWNHYLKDINQKVREKAKEYLAHLEGTGKGR